MTELSVNASRLPLFVETLNGERNKLLHSDRAFHDWYRFVLSFPPHLVRQYIEEFGLGKKDILLDPFCGTGTTVVESRLHNIPSIGIEANKFAHFAGSVKIDWNVVVSDLLEHATEIKERTISRLSRQGISDVPGEHIHLPNELRKLSVNQEKLILKDSISPLPLHKALILLDEIKRFRETTYLKYLKLAFAKTLVFKISNLRFGPEVGVGKAKADVAVVDAWFNEIRKICGDLADLDGKRYASARVILSDSRDAINLLQREKISAVITSPPYPNEKDYTRTTRLESVLLGFIADKDELRMMKKSLLRSNTRGVYKDDNDDQYVAGIEEIQKIAKEIEERRIKLNKTSGFERLYARVTKLYFGGMAKHLIQLKSVLKPGAHLAYVVGDQASYLRVMIRTGQILETVAKSVGYEAIRIDQFRTRFSTVTKSDLNEEVVVLRWPG